MKKYNMILMLIFSFELIITSVSSVWSCQTGGPEIYFHIQDTQGNMTWHILAVAKNNTVVYDLDFNTTFMFNSASKSFIVTDTAETSCDGFDWITDPAYQQQDNPDIGYGIYDVIVTRGAEETVLNFVLDMRWPIEVGVILIPPIYTST